MNIIGKMCENLNYCILRNIFKYFNATELDVLSKVCRSWSKAVEDEIASRGPICIITTLGENESMGDMHSRFREALRNLRIKPCIQFQIIENYFNSHYINGCPCSYFPNSCYSLYLKNVFVRIDSNRIVNMIIPDVPSLQIITRTFVSLPWTTGLFCVEQNYNSEFFFLNAKDLKDDFVNFLSADNTEKRCMILFSKLLNSDMVQLFIEHFLSWFPNIEINVWGGILDEIKICSFNYKLSLCCGETNFACIFINGTEMETWILTFDEDCNDKEKIERKLAEFKQNLQLKNHSMGFMYITYRRAPNFFLMEFTAFKQMFPGTPLFYILGSASFGEDLKATLGTLKTSQQRIQRLETRLMILTYN